MGKEIEYTIAAPKGFRLDLKELWGYRELFYFFTWRDIKVKYKQTVLGFLWSIIQPAMMAAIFTLFFGRALNIPSDNIPYPVFVFSGLILWNLFASTISSAGTSMITNSQIIKKIYFPRLVIPISSLLVSLFDFLMSIPVLICILLVYQTPINLIEAIVFFPLSLISAIMGSIGLGCLLAALSVKYRDFRYVIPFLLQVLLFMTPVIYPVSIIQYPGLKYLLALNPMFAPITLFRVPMVHVISNPDLVIISLISGLVLLLLGLGYFKRTETFFADLA